VKNIAIHGRSIDRESLPYVTDLLENLHKNNFSISITKLLQSENPDVAWSSVNTVDESL
jgi:hypothetical protein